MEESTTITARRKLTFNLGRYESMESEIFLVGIPVDTDPEEISQQLDLLVAPEVERAEFATTHHPDDNITSVYAWREITDRVKEGS